MYSSHDRLTAAVGACACEEMVRGTALKLTTKKIKEKLFKDMLKCCTVNRKTFFLRGQVLKKIPTRLKDEI